MYLPTNSSLSAFSFPFNNFASCEPTYGTSLTVSSCNSALKKLQDLESFTSPILTSTNSTNNITTTIITVTDSNETTTENPLPPPDPLSNPSRGPRLPLTVRSATCSITISPAGPFDYAHNPYLLPRDFSLSAARRYAQMLIENCVEQQHGRGGWMASSTWQLNRYLERKRLNFAAAYPPETAFFTVAVTRGGGVVVASTAEESDAGGGGGVLAKTTTTVKNNTPPPSLSSKEHEHEKEQDHPGDYHWRIAYGLSLMLRDAQQAEDRGTVYWYNLGARMRRLRDVSAKMKVGGAGWRWWDNPYRKG